MQQHYKIVFVLGADVEKDSKGNLVLAKVDKSNLPLYSEWRLRAVQWLWQKKLADKCVIVGGKEGRYPAENILRPQVMKDLLIDTCGVPESLLVAQESEPNTTGNMVAIECYLKENAIDAKECAFLTNFYHIPRALVYLHDIGLFLRPLAAESFFIEKEPEIRRDYGQAEFDFHDRLIAELKGMLSKEVGKKI